MKLVLFTPAPSPLTRLVETYERERAFRGSGCPHCNCRRIHRWGQFRQRRRYRCTACGRTFSTFTGTPLSHLKKVELWAAYTRCIQQRHPVRKAARQLGIDKDTAFRWRHRLLAALVGSDHLVLGGRVELGQFSIPRSEKGSRSLGRAPRKRGSPLPFHTAPRIRVVVARSSTGGLLLESAGRGLVDAAEIERFLPHRLNPLALVIRPQGRYVELERMLRRCGIRNVRARYRFRQPLGHTLLVGREVAGWLRPFRGVATRYLRNYLVWYRVDRDCSRSRRAGRGRLYTGRLG